MLAVGDCCSEACGSGRGDHLSVDVICCHHCHRPTPRTRAGEDPLSKPTDLVRAEIGTHPRPIPSTPTLVMGCWCTVVAIGAGEGNAAKSSPKSFGSLSLSLRPRSTAGGSPQGGVGTGGEYGGSGVKGVKGGRGISAGKGVCGRNAGEMT